MSYKDSGMIQVPTDFKASGCMGQCCGLLNKKIAIRGRTFFGVEFYFMFFFEC